MFAFNCHRYIIIIKNNKGPTIDPCGKLYDIPEIPEKGFCKFTVNLWFDREYRNNLTVWLEKLIIPNFCKIMSWLMVSNAL